MKKLTIDQKLIKIGEYNPGEYLARLYKKGMSCNEIAEKLLADHNISITARGLSERIRLETPLRGKQAAKLNAIKRGRMVYYKKPEHEKYKGKMINLTLRLNIFQRDNHACQICGNGPANNHTIEIHHIDFNPKNNAPENLKTLCFLCHRGTHAANR